MNHPLIKTVEFVCVYSHDDAKLIADARNEKAGATVWTVKALAGEIVRNGLPAFIVYPVSVSA